MVMGMGQYPNLGTQDAFACVRRGDQHRVVRASKRLDDRMDTSVGPFRVEIIEPLQKVRFILEPTEHDIACDLTWDGAIPAFEEPRQYIRKFGRVLFDTMRFAQTGCWTGTLEVAGETIDVTPDRWKGTRDRSWGVRPVGEVEPPGIRGEAGQMAGTVELRADAVRRLLDPLHRERGARRLPPDERGRADLGRSRP